MLYAAIIFLEQNGVSSLSCTGFLQIFAVLSTMFAQARLPPFSVHCFTVLFFSQMYRRLFLVEGIIHEGVTTMPWWPSS